VKKREILFFLVRFKNRTKIMDSGKTKAVEKLVISQIKPKVKNIPKQPENEQINTAVIKVLQGYDWTLVPAAAK
jgi:vacuolar-type H+-ATPase subunit E/Vma4